MAITQSIIRPGALLLSLVLAGGCASTYEARAENEDALDSAGINAQFLVAEIAFERGDCKAATETYADAASRSHSPPHARRAAEIALACENLPAAWRAVTNWRSLQPEDREAAALYSAVALKLHYISRAREALSSVLKTGSDEADRELVALTAVLLEEATPASVLAAVSGALEGASLSPTVLALLAELALKTPDLTLAEKYANEALRADPKLLAAKRVMVQIHVQRGDATKAIALSREIEQADAENGAFEVADTLAALERLEEARQELERLRATTQNKTAEINRRLALLALQSRDYEEARKRFTDLALSGEAGEAALFYIAEIADRSGDTDSALSGYRELAESSFAVEARIRAARILLQRKQHAEAMAMLDDYAAMNPSSSFDLLLAKAHLLVEHGEADKGLKLLVAAQDRYPRHPTLQYDQAVLLERAGRVQEAIEVLEQLLADRPEDPVILNALGYTLADHGLELERAERLVERALAVTPDSPAVLDSLGWVRFRRGDTQRAISLLERAYAFSRDPEIAAHLGEVLWVSGDQKGARRVWATALARNPDSKPLKATLARFVPPDQP